MSKRFLNDPENCVEEVIQGMVQSDPSVKRISGHHVLVRADFEVTGCV